ncbi:MAG TPA: hypothetical protein VNE62_12580 [Actinomycetota bacterium]|nr:hypothetical protein [Actinomycetota bacterium]
MRYIVHASAGMFEIEAENYVIENDFVTFFGAPRGSKGKPQLASFRVETVGRIEADEHVTPHRPPAAETADEA